MQSLNNIPVWLLPLDVPTLIPTRSFRSSFYNAYPNWVLAAHLFHDWRFLDDAGNSPNPDFVLNFPALGCFYPAGA